jgi:hypothetical protein
MEYQVLALNCSLVPALTLEAVTAVAVGATIFSQEHFHYCER